jgi:hypothetical protein
VKWIIVQSVCRYTSGQREREWDTERTKLKDSYQQLQAEVSHSSTRSNGQIPAYFVRLLRSPHGRTERVLTDGLRMIHRVASPTCLCLPCACFVICV